MNVEVVARVDTLRAYVTASGEIVATRYADLGSSVMGRLVDLRVREGDKVLAGQALARIDPVQAESAVAAMSAALNALEAVVQNVLHDLGCQIHPIAHVELFDEEHQGEDEQQLARRAPGRRPATR